MERVKKDEFLDEIDRELETLNKRLRDVMSEAEELLQQQSGEPQPNGVMDSERDETEHCTGA
jgi:cell division septum initiation protein DivIVA